MPQLANQLRLAFDADGVAVLGHAGGDDWQVLASAGDVAIERPDDADVVVPLQGDDVLVLRRRTFGDDDREVLRAFAGQVAIAVQQRELRADAERADGLAEANELRTALLAAVSHDLRTPLSSIKASVTSLLQRDVDFTPAATRELLETDRRGGRPAQPPRSGNLLDMSRLQTGAVQLVMRDVGLDEVLPARSPGSPQADRVEVDVDETLPRVRADAALLERAIANVVENAIAWSPPAATVRVEACVAAASGSTSTWSTAVPASRRRSARTSSARSSDWATAPTAAESGSASPWRAASSRRWVASCSVEDTPGGGVTMVISLPAAT